jgi:hypothetical protein
MDESGASYYIHKNNENKGSQIGHTKNNIKKNTLIFWQSISTFLLGQQLNLI